MLHLRGTSCPAITGTTGLSRITGLSEHGERWEIVFACPSVVLIHFVVYFFHTPTVKTDVKRVAPLPSRRLAPVDCAVILLGSVELAASGGRNPPVITTAGHLSKRLSVGACGPEDLPPMKPAVVPTVQRQFLILKQLRRFRGRCE